MLVPAVSVVIPAHESHETIAGCLEALRAQTWRDFEVVIVDSSPGRRTQEVIANFPEVRYVRSEVRLLPHAARNLGFQSAIGRILVSTDPDVYPAPDWLERLVECHQQTGHAVAGSVTCFGGRWFDWGVHFCKYHGSLPYKPAGPVGSAASASLLVTREMYDTIGCFNGSAFCGDYLFTTALVGRGYTLWFEPRACVSHRHIVAWRPYIAERFARGKDFGRIRARTLGWSNPRLLLWILISVLPPRLARLLARTARSAQRGGVLNLYLSTLPAVALGFGAWLAGEAAAYAESLFSLGRRRTQPSA